MGNGLVMWTDLTVDNADGIRDFYSSVLGWMPEDCAMSDGDGAYADYNMKPSSEHPGVAGICHHRGVNAGIPPQWLIYVSVASVEESISRCLLYGGKIIHGPREIHGKAFCVIEDPAGAILGIIQGDKETNKNT